MDDGRRTFLRGVGITSAAGLAGCVDMLAGDPEDGGTADGGSGSDGAGASGVAQVEFSAVSELNTDGTWPRSGYDAKNSAAIDKLAVDSDDPGVVDRFALDHDITYTVAPTLGPENLYLSVTTDDYVDEDGEQSQERSIVAVGKQSGERLWKQVGRNAPPIWPRQQPTYHDGTVYATKYNGSLSAYDAAGGDELWSFGERLKIIHQPLVDGGNLVVAENSEQTVYALDAASGDETWSRQLDVSGNFGGPVAAGGTLFLAPAQEPLTALDSETGEVLWEADESVGEQRKLACDDGHAYVLDETSLRAYGVEDGELAWEFGESEHVGKILYDGVYFVANDGGATTLLDAESGEELATMDARLGSAEEHDSAIVAGNALVWIDQAEATVTATDLQTGETSWSVQLDVPSGTTLVEPAVGNGRLYLPTVNDDAEVPSTEIVVIE